MRITPEILDDIRIQTARKDAPPPKITPAMQEGILKVSVDVPAPVVPLAAIPKLVHAAETATPGRGRICIVGYPSRVGGADTELDHQIDVWQRLGVEVHAIPTGDPSPEQKGILLEERGCVVHKSNDWQACRNMHVISYCNGPFLTAAARIREYALSTTFVNCMTWLFANERKAAADRYLDYEIYQRKEVHDSLFPQLAALNPHLRGFVVKPYFRASDFPYIPYKRRKHDKFVFGRIHREDPFKLHPRTVEICEKISSPVPKECIILGMHDACARKIGRMPAWMKGYRANAFTQTEFYGYVDHIVNPADPQHTENLPRIAFESAASGLPMLVDNKGGWTELVEHEKTGFLCGSPEDYIKYGSLLAQNRDLAARISGAAYIKLTTKFSIDAAMWEWESFFRTVGVL